MSIMVSFLEKINISLVFMLIFISGTAYARTDARPDTENCLYCHRYPAMGRYDKSGNKKVFYINDKLFAQSVHGKLKCTNCHVGLDQIPHTDVKKVDCATKCHIKEPSSNKEFSHDNMITKYRLSVHGEGAVNNPKPYPEDRPTCKYCHDNRIYSSFSGAWGKSKALSNETLGRCLGCHEKKEWAETFYSHFTHRMRKRRSQEEVIRLCTSCHEDTEKMARHGIESIETFKDTFHWEQVKFGYKNAPDCISCHVPVGYSTHEIHPRMDPESPTNHTNRVKTCSNQGGVQECHPGATEQFASGRVHAYGMKAQIVYKNNLPHDGDKGQSLLITRAESETSEKEQLQFKILKLIRLGYQLLITGTIGFMFLHQLLDYRRERKRK